MGSLRITSGNQQNNKGGSQATGIVILAFSAVIFLCLLTDNMLFGGFGAFIKSFFEGIFGVTSYAISLGGILAGYLLIVKRSISIPKRYTRALLWLFLSFVLIIHFSTTSSYLYAAADWGEYIMTCYDVQNNILSGGGVIAAVLLYPIGKFAGLVGTYLLLSIVTLVCFMVLTNFSLLKLFSLFKREKSERPLVGKPDKKVPQPKISVKKGRESYDDIPAFWVKKAPVENAVTATSNSSNVETDRTDRTDRAERPDRPIVKEVREGDKYYTNLKNHEPREYREYPEEKERPKSKLYPDKKLPYEELFRPKINENESYLKNFEQNAGTHKSLYEKFQDEPAPRPETRREIPPQVRRPTIVIHNPAETGMPQHKEFPNYSLDTPEAQPQSTPAKEQPSKKPFSEHPEFFPHKYHKTDEPQEAIVDGESFSKQKLEQQQKQQVVKNEPRQSEPKSGSLKPIEQLKPPITPNIKDKDAYKATPSEETPKARPLQSDSSNDFVSRDDFEEVLNMLEEDEAVDPTLPAKSAKPETLNEIIKDTTPEEQQKAREEAISIIKPFTGNKGKPEQIGIRLPEENNKEPLLGTPKIKRARYKAPPIDLLHHIETSDKEPEDYETNKQLLENTLAEFKISAKVTGIVCGPTVTRYELEMAPGIPVRRVISVADDIAMRLSAVGGIRIEAPIPGRNLFGIEVPNLNTETVSLRSIIESAAFKNKNNGLFFALGKDIGGKDIVQDLADMPHLLLAGATGQGKSVCLNSLIISLLYKYSPEELRLILVDPKTVEFGVYNGMPHLMLQDVVTTPEAAVNAFAWLIKEMDRRYAFFHATGTLNINAYNAAMDGTEYDKLPRIVLVADELADLMLNHKSEIEPKILKLAAKARAAGIHLVLATQRPSVDVITGTIKTNLPYRIALRVTSLVDSRTILDQAGSEKLIGKGDMLLKTATLPEPVRLQGAYVSSDEVRSVVEYLKSTNESHFDKSIEAKIMKNSGGGEGGDDGDSERDKLFTEALRYCIEAKSASIAMIQRRFGVGYARAGKIVEDMERLGFISGFEGSKARQILITMEEFEQRYGGDD